MSKRLMTTVQIMIRDAALIHDGSLKMEEEEDEEEEVEEEVEVVELNPIDRVPF